jgi:outer membrane protein OmpA-like peptidoglycan-associated protein
MHPLYVTKATDDAYLGRDACAARSVFTTYPFKNFAVAAIGLNAPGSQEFIEYLENEPAETPYFGTPYILVRGALALGAGCGGRSDYVPSGEECDLGDNGNGVPAGDGQPAETTCSFSCRLNWCGDGVVDPVFGEQCDRGFYNGRTPDGNGAIVDGMCTRSCQLVDFPQPPNSPPVARCKNVTVSAPSNACGAPANINDGSFDPEDGTNITCEQSPVGPYNIGNTTVTLTCRDSLGQVDSCTSTVTVRDITPPTVAVGTPHRTMECANTTYGDLIDVSASDLCSNPLTNLGRTGSVNMRVPGSYQLTYSYRDAALNVGSANRTVNVVDTRVPTISLSLPTTMAVECATAYVEPGYSASDACYGDLRSSVVVDGTVNTAVLGSYSLYYRLTDPSGNVASPKLRTVTVRDTTLPTVTILGELNQTVECNDPAYQDPGATASDTCAGTLTAVASPPPNAGVVGTQTIQYQATDPSGNVGTSSNSRTLTVVDTLPPVVTLHGTASMTLECASPWNDPGATANDQCAGDITGLIQRTGSVNNMQLAPYQLTYSVTDPSGRSDSKERAVTVRDTLVPEITVRGPLTDSFECGQTYADPGATANDACAGEMPVTSTREGNSNQPGEVIIRYSAQDPSGNRVTSLVERRVTVNDNAPPSLVLLGSGTQSVECGTSWHDPGATANDACFGDLTASITREGSVHPGVTGSYPLTYRVTDPAGLSAEPVHRTVNVNDTLAPAITVLGPLTQSVQCNHLPYEDPGATAADQCAGNLTGAIVRTGSVNTGAAGSYTLSYRVADPSGNQTTAAESRTVTVVDDLAPTISLNGPANSTHECGSPYNDPGATANDVCGGNLTANLQRSGAVNGGTPGSYTLGYTVTDPSGLMASTQRQVTVNDTLAPALALIGPATQNVECGPGYQDPGATATDACAGNLDAQIVVTGAANPLVVGNYNVSYAVSDNAGNAAGPLNREVRVRDTVTPNIIVNGPLDQQFECGNTYVDPGAEASDVCAGQVAVTSTRSGNPNQPGSFTITYSAQDPSGNTVTSPVTRTVRVNDNEEPTLVLLGEATQTLECGSTWTDPGARANDACYGDLTAAITVSGSVNPAAPGNYPIIYNVTDGSGNSAPSVNRTVQVRDTVLPVITVRGPATDSYECGSTYQDPGATALDSCAGDVTSAMVATRNSDPNAPTNFTITYSVADPSGNTAVAAASRTVMMNDNTPPSISLNGPATQVLECSRGTYDDPGATANDLCVGPVPVTVAGSVNMGRPDTYRLSYLARDTAGNTSPPLTRNVTITDTIGPAITLNGPNAVELECNVDTYTDTGATAEDICSGPAPVTVDNSAVNEDVPGAYLVRYRATDASGNTSETVRNVVVVDNLPPAISLNEPNPMIIECATPFHDPGATANDLCQGDVSSSVFIEFNGVDNMTETDLTGVHSYYQVRYQAQDRFGRSAFATRQVGVNDSVGPVLTVVGTPTAEIECGSQPDLGVQATDACYGILPSSAITATPAILPTAVGEYDVTYSATDPAGNITLGGARRHFKVVDTMAPTITINGPIEQQFECGDTYVDPGAIASDTCADMVEVIAERTGSSTMPGTFTITYLARDPSGNTVTSPVTRTVRVNDSEAPTLVLLGGATQTLECGTPWDDPGARANDACAGDLTSAIRRSGSVNAREPGDYTLTYEVADEANNDAPPVSRQVAVVDTRPPSIVCPESIVVEASDGLSATVDLGTASVTDACSKPRVSIPSRTLFPVGTTTVTYTAMDMAGNTAACDLTVTVVVDRALLGSGNGCSSAGSGPSSLAIMGLGVLAALLARKRMWPGLLALGVLLFGARASAQLRGVPTFELELLKLNPGGTGSLLLGTGELLPGGGHRLSLTTHYENDPLVLFQNGEKMGVVVRHRATAHLAGAYGLWGWVELGAQVPILLLQRGDDLAAHGIGRPEGGLTPGTPLLSLRVKLLAEREADPVDLSLGVHAGPPVGSGAALARELRATPSLMAGHRFRFLHAAIDAGILLRPRTILSQDENIQDELGHALRLGGTLSTLGEAPRGELTVIARVPLKREGSSIEALAGARWPVSDSFEAYGLAGLAFGNAPGTPDFRVLFGMAYGRARSPRVESIQQAPVPNPPELPDSSAQDGEAVPEKDSDRDDILDENDACPTEAGIPEMHGCPAGDSDHDTVRDHLDNCPEVAGPVDNQGCPAEERQLVAIQKDRIEIKDTVHFDFANATIQSRSYPLLDQVARILTEHPEILSVTIEGHTDERGSAEYNRDLSQRRAEAVRDYLAQKGVARERMQAQGFGEDRPVQSNGTDEGRAANRRVEFITRYTQAEP